MKTWMHGSLCRALATAGLLTAALIGGRAAYAAEPAAKCATGCQSGCRMEVDGAGFFLELPFIGRLFQCADSGPEPACTNELQRVAVDFEIVGYPGHPGFAAPAPGYAELPPGYSPAPQGYQAGPYAMAPSSLGAKCCSETKCGQDCPAIASCTAAGCAVVCSAGKCCPEQCSTAACSAQQCSAGKCSTGKCCAECVTAKCCADKCCAGKCGQEACCCGPAKTIAMVGRGVCPYSAQSGFAFEHLLGLTAHNAALAATLETQGSMLAERQEILDMLAEVTIEKAKLEAIVELQHERDEMHEQKQELLSENARLKSQLELAEAKAEVAQQIVKMTLENEQLKLQVVKLTRANTLEDDEPRVSRRPATAKRTR